MRKFESPCDNQNTSTIQHTHRMQDTKSATRRGKNESRPWSTMAINDQFFVSASDVLPSSLRSIAYKKGIDLDRKFSVLKADGGVTVVRVE